MVAVVIPSDEVPGPAPIQLDLPENWVVSPAPSVSAIALAPAVDGHFRPNAVITHARLPADADLGVISDAANDVISRLPGLERGIERRRDRADRQAVVREYAYTDEGSGLGLYQVQLQMLIPIGFGLVDLVTLTATCSGAQLDVVPVLRSIVESATVAP